MPQRLTVLGCGRQPDRNDPVDQGQPPVGFRLRGDGHNGLRRTILGNPQGGKARYGDGRQGRGLKRDGNVAGRAGHSVGLGITSVGGDAPVEPPGAGLFGLLGDIGHSAHRPGRIAADCGFFGQHDRIAAVQHGVGHIGDFGAGGAGRGDHRDQHMGGGNDRLGLLVGLPDQALLDVRDAGKRGLDAQSPRGRS